MNQLERLGIAFGGGLIELVLRAFGAKWKLDHQVVYDDPEGWTLTAPKGFEYDSFTWAPNLRKENGDKSDAAAIHDVGWETGAKDDGTILTFDENNRAFRAVLDREGHPEWVKGAYERGVSLPFMRKKWLKKHGHK